MRILLTNDDGIAAPGLNALREALCGLASQLFVVAPERERSATGHGITVHKPLRVEEINYGENNCQGWSVSGTPADCVKLALDILLPAHPDLVISGINLGANLGTDVLYSGTVSAAIEGLMAGIPSFAVSLTSNKVGSDFSPAALFARHLVKILFSRELPRETLLNVNVPDVDLPGEIKGVKITKLALRRYQNTVEKRLDPRGRAYYWLTGEVFAPEPDDDADVWAVHEQYISVSPIHFDLTDHRIIEEVRNWGITPGNPV
ncbi:MAG: 5'/3'-nucleotidase SurE [Bacillota bacterium]